MRFLCQREENLADFQKTIFEVENSFSFVEKVDTQNHIMTQIFDNVERVVHPNLSQSEPNFDSFCDLQTMA